MKIILLITHSDTIGGAHVHVKDLASALIAMGHTVTVFVGRKGPFTDILAASGIPFLSLLHLQRQINPVEDFRAVREIRDQLLTFSPDLVSCHSSKAGWIGRIAAKLAGVPAVFTVHGWAFACGVPGVRRVIYRCAESLTAPLSRRIIAVSDCDRQLAIQSGVAKPDLIITVLNGIPDIAAQHTTSISLRPVRLVMVARLVKQKNHAGLLQALASLTQLDWTMDFVGEGPLSANLKHLAKALGIGERINFPGYLDNVPALLARSDVFVLSTNWEGLPLGILEAMRAGLPVVASDTGGVCEAVQDGKTGFLVPRGDISTLGDRLASLIEDRELRIRMGQAGRIRYEKHFTLDRMINETLTVYRKALKT